MLLGYHQIRPADEGLVNHADFRLKGFLNRRSDVQIVPGAPINSSTERKMFQSSLPQVAPGLRFGPHCHLSPTDLPIHDFVFRRGESTHPWSLEKRSVQVGFSHIWVVHLGERRNWRSCVFNHEIGGVGCPPFPNSESMHGKGFDYPIVCKRFEAMTHLAQAGISMHVFITPVIPGLNEHDPRIRAPICHLTNLGCQGLLVSSFGKYFMDCWKKMCRHMAAFFSVSRNVEVARINPVLW